MTAPPRLYIDSWDPSYGTAFDAAESGPTIESSAQLNLDVELAAASWRPVAAPGDVRTPDVVLLVDGVRRIDARIWVEDPDGTVHPGIAASYAAGVVRCDLRHGSANIAASRISRGIFTASVHATDLMAANTRYVVHRVTADDPAQLSAAVQPFLSEIEAELSTLARATTMTETQEAAGLFEDDLLVVDGPLRGRAQLPRALGYIKTHRVQYLPAALSTMAGRMAPGQRSPVFLLGTTWHRYTWYLRLPGPAAAPWSGVVRVEASADLSRAAAIGLADVSAVTLPRFASSPYKDPRAPQNLTPIAGLERRLRGMLGDQRLLLRALTAAAAAQRETGQVGVVQGGAANGTNPDRSDAA
jgi:hypothetical protein